MPCSAVQPAELLGVVLVLSGMLVLHYTHELETTYLHPRAPGCTRLSPQRQEHANLYSVRCSPAAHGPWHIHSTPKRHADDLCLARRANALSGRKMAPGRSGGPRCPNCLDSVHATTTVDGMHACISPPLPGHRAGSPVHQACIQPVRKCLGQGLASG